MKNSAQFNRIEGISDYLLREVGLEKGKDISFRNGRIDFTFNRDRPTYPNAGLASLVDVYQLAQSCGLQRDNSHPTFSLEKGTNVSFKLGKLQKFKAYEPLGKNQRPSIRELEERGFSSEITTIEGIDKMILKNEELFSLYLRFETDKINNRKSRPASIYELAFVYDTGIFGERNVKDFLEDMGCSYLNYSGLNKLRGRRVKIFFDESERIHAVAPIESFPVRN